MAKKERPKCDVCGVTHWAGEPHRIDPAIAADIIKKLELRIVELERQLLASKDVPVMANPDEFAAGAVASCEIAPMSCLSTASHCYPQDVLSRGVNGQLQMQANALNYLLQTGGLRRG